MRHHPSNIRDNLLVQCHLNPCPSHICRNEIYQFIWQLELRAQLPKYTPHWGYDRCSIRWQHAHCWLHLFLNSLMCRHSHCITQNPESRQKKVAASSGLAFPRYRSHCSSSRPPISTDYPTIMWVTTIPPLLRWVPQALIWCWTLSFRVRVIIHGYRNLAHHFHLQFDMNSKIEDDSWYLPWALMSKTLLSLGVFSLPR